MLATLSTADLYQQYVHTMQKIADVKGAMALLQWDEETYLPAQGAEGRGRQLATLSELAHELATADKLGSLLNDLMSRDHLPQRAAKSVALSLEDYNKAKKYKPAFVREMSETVSRSFHAWIDARRHNNYQSFAPLLQQIINLKKQESELLGYEVHPYNAHLNEFEKGATVTMLDAIFEEIKAPLKNLLNEVMAKPVADDWFLKQHFAKGEQWQWANKLAGLLGFNFTGGRQDVSEHPFSTGINTGDVRITTRIDENDFSNMTWSTIHEVGHALYEQGLPADEYGLPVGEYASLSIHESQSRLWENCVGRGLPFWKFHFSSLQNIFPVQFAGVDADLFVKGINKVSPSLIRTEADELTYHFHVMIRYELEKQLLSGQLLVKDIPVYWNDQYKQLLGVTVPNDVSGCLQDVHWSHGSFGYFATYSLGSFYAAQFWKQANMELPGLLTEIETTGSTATLLGWLRTNVHAYGKLYNSEALCTKVTGSGLNSKIFLNYLQHKFLGV